MKPEKTEKADEAAKHTRKTLEELEGKQTWLA